VWLHILLLQQQFTQDEIDEEEDDQILKRDLLQVLEEKFEIRQEHKIATFLHPSFKSFQFKFHVVPILEKMDVQNHVRSLAKNVAVDEPHSLSAATSGIDEPQSKKARIADDDLLANFCSNATSSPMNDEVEKWISEPDQPVKDDDILAWWKQKAHAYPRLSSLARKYLAVPATSAASEIVFSMSRKVVTDLRTSLKPETVRQLLFIHYNG
jgi:hypothetical protein